MDTARAAAQFCLPAVERRDPNRGDRPSGRPREHPHDGKVYRKELRPVLRRGAKAMDDLFNAHHEASEPPTLPPASTEDQTKR
jgi:hypothetical protein